MIPKKYLAEELEKFGIPQSDEVICKLDIFSDMLVSENKKFNLTAITDPEEIAIKHFLDSLSVLKFVDFKPCDRVADVGAGAGFPSVPLMIARPDINVTMLDGTRKRLDFIDSVIKELNLNGQTLHMRAEIAGRDENYRESFDKVVSRAVANLNTLSEYCLPLVKKNGLFVAMKGRDGSAELKCAEGAVKTLAGDPVSENKFCLPGDEERNIIVIKKISQLLPKYPRSSAKISKSPLK